MRPEGWERMRRVMAVRLDNIGDVVMLGPALKALAAALPDAAITLMATPAGSQAAPLLPWVDDVFVLRPVWQDVSGAMPLDPAREMAIIDSLRAREFDAALIFTSFSQSPYPPAYLCYLAGIPIRLGQSKEFGGGILSRWVKPPADDAHQVDRNLHLLRAAGFDVAEDCLDLSIPGPAAQSASELLRAQGLDPEGEFTLIAPGASCATRRYPPERYAAVALKLAEATGMPIVLAGSERERPRIQPAEAALQDPRVVSLIGQTSLAEFASLVRRASLVIANNSAALHFADACLRPMVILYSGSDLETQWRPRHAPSILLRRPTDCSPCYEFHCPYHMECLDLSPEEVVRAVQKLLSRAVKAV